MAKALLAGWNVAGILRYESGRPLNITMNNDLGGLLFNGQKRPNRVSGAEESPPEGTSIRTATVTSTETPGRIRVRLRFGNAPKRDTTVRSFPVYSEDLNIFKVFPLPNEHKIRFESMFGNIFNRTLFCDPNPNWSSGAFGQISTQGNQPRSIQFALRYDF